MALAVMHNLAPEELKVTRVLVSISKNHYDLLLFISVQELCWVVCVIQQEEWLDSRDTLPRGAMRCCGLKIVDQSN